jgi:protein TonB
MGVVHLGVSASGRQVAVKVVHGSYAQEEEFRTRFRQEIAADGKVQNCTITGSSGYPELDKATCDLITRRARFEAAKDETGARTSGSYTSSVRWELPG